ncbi:SRPBCC family protein [Haliea sp. E17]|uniref:SRPBCC family protein n=1 Tax=Haliea sp. E17 TaxID=3401576 RepID=UPI003AAF193C
MGTQLPGASVDTAPLLSELDFTEFPMRVDTARYCAEDYHRRERDRLWSRCWQVVGREEELAKRGDWLEYRLFDQSFLLLRDGNGLIRGFVNACRHRGNALCEGRGNSARLVCPYHRWSFDLEGQLVGVPRPDFDGSLEEFVGCREELGLIAVPVECFAGFIFLNPDSEAPSLADYLGEIATLLAPYRMQEMVACGLNVRESLDCNWKVVMDAFQEGYHIQGIHPELVNAMDESRERYRFLGDHSVATAPFGAANTPDITLEQQAEAIRGLPATFPGVADSLPAFERLLQENRQGQAGHLPEGVTPRLLLQQAMRETLSARGLDVSGLTDTQMSDNQFYLVFPNLFLTIHAGEATFISAVPHPDGDPNRCIWHVSNFQWFPETEREAQKLLPTDVPEGEHFNYFLALEQDFDQMQRQQKGLRNRALTHLALSRQEVRLAHFHRQLDRWQADPES